MPRLGSAVPHFAHAHRPHSVARKLAPSFRSAPSAVFHSLTLRARRRAFFIYRNLNIFLVFFRQNKGKWAFCRKKSQRKRVGCCESSDKNAVFACFVGMFAAILLRFYANEENYCEKFPTKTCFCRDLSEKPPEMQRKSPKSIRQKTHNSSFCRKVCGK